MPVRCHSVVGQRLEQLEAGGTHPGEDSEGWFDRAVVVEPPGELLLVVPDDRRVVFGDQPAQPDIGSRLAVGEVMSDLTGGPAVGRPSIELVWRDAGQSVDDVVDCRFGSGRGERFGPCRSG